MTATAALPYALDRTVTIAAPRDTVFRYFTDIARWAAWWGSGSTIDPRPGGRVYIRYPGGIDVSGQVLEIVPPDRIVFTYGFDSGTPIPAGSSRVTIRLAASGDSTELTLVHELPDAGARDQHVQGWRYQLALFANVVADEVNRGAADVVDLWFAAWANRDAVQRTSVLNTIAVAAVAFRDRFGATHGVEDLVAHIAAAQQFMPGVTLKRDGDVRHCQGTVLANWTAIGPDGQPRGKGTNVFQFDACGKVTSVVGFWA